MFKVFDTSCNQCLFSSNKIVSNSRRADILEDCLNNDGHFICHKASQNDDDICCRGFFDGFSTNLIRIAGRLNMIETIELEGYLEKGTSG